MKQELQRQGNGELTLSTCSQEEIKQPLRYAMVAVGLKAKNFPAEEEKLVLVNFIRKQYSTYTPAEIAFAFELAMARRLPLDNPCCFENFSCEYIGKVLSAYEKWDSSPIDSRCAALEGMWSSRQANDDRGAAQGWYERFLAGEFIDFIPGNVYRVLQRDRMIKAIPNPVERREYPKFLKVMAYFEHARQQGMPYLYTKEPLTTIQE